MIEAAHWQRAAALATAVSGAPEPGAALHSPVGAANNALSAGSAAATIDLTGLRAAVAGILAALARRMEEALPGALATAPQAWDRVDDLLKFFDPSLTAHVAEVRRALEVAAMSPSQPAARAAGVEGLLVVEAACGLARLCQQRLSSLIRLRVRSGDDDLLPGGRPFLDFAAALREAARAWA